MAAIYKTLDERLDELFGNLRHASESREQPSKKVAIVSTPRCGSKFFCESLASTRSFGYPIEWMNPSYINAYIRTCKPPTPNLAEYLNFVVGRTTSPNRIFSLNFHVDQYMYWQKSGFDLLTLNFDKIYRLQRKDKLAQALSYAKATATGRWRSTDSPLENASVSQVTTSMIVGALHKISLWDEFYDSHLARFVHKSYWYEDCLADASNFCDVLQDCGVEHKGINFSCDVKIQRVASDQTELKKLEKYLGCGVSRV